MPFIKPEYDSVQGERGHKANAWSVQSPGSGGRMPTEAGKKHTLANTLERCGDYLSLLIYLKS
jgi:hypothetical protein